MSTGVKIRISAADWNGIWRVETFRCFETAVAVKTGNAGVTISNPEVRASRIASYRCNTLAALPGNLSFRVTLV
jgi:hypothetical protein